MNKTPQLGQWYQINQQCGKVKHPRKHDDPRYIQAYTTWETYPSSKDNCRGMYIGKRTVYEGEIHNDSGEFYAPYFVRKSQKTVWLFVLDGKTNPVYAFPEDVRW